MRGQTILRDNLKNMANSQMVIAGAGLGTLSLITLLLFKPRQQIQSTTKTTNTTKTQTTNVIQSSTKKTSTSSTKAGGVTSAMMQKYHKTMLKASKYKYVRYQNHTASAMVRDGHGDCWAMAEYLFNELKEAGFKVRIRRGKTRLSDDHRWTEIYLNGKWSPVAYRKYKISPYFAYTSSVYNVKTFKVSS